VKPFYFNPFGRASPEAVGEAGGEALPNRAILYNYILRDQVLHL